MNSVYIWYKLFMYNKWQNSFLWSLSFIHWIQMPLFAHSVSGSQVLWALVQHTVPFYTHTYILCKHWRRQRVICARREKKNPPILQLGPSRGNTWAIIISITFSLSIRVWHSVSVRLICALMYLLFNPVTLQVPIYKFSRLIFMHLLKELVERLW